MVRDTTVLMDEKRVFEPSEEVKNRAHVKDWDAEIEKGKDLGKYWAQQAEQFDWIKKWDKVLDDSNKPFYKWFTGGKINLAYNAVDRWIETEKRNQIAIIYINERGHEKKITYYELYLEVNKLANALKNLGVKKGDTVSMYLPMCPELMIALLACNKIGAVHSVVYSGLSVGAFVDRMNDVLRLNRGNAVLDRLPYCLDANLILGQIWTSGGREEEADVHLKRAQALDPQS
ncbi:MAG TPA: AMP-binding protein, partial [Methanobacteriaceae archaeon]|nr:AMP-binding protein [Methanobacteriaceae archaeon]